MAGKLTGRAAQAALAAAVLLLAAVFAFPGIGWLAPSAALRDRVVPPGFIDARAADAMASARAYVYKDNKGHIAASPHLRTDDFAAKPKVAVDYPAEGGSFYFYNYLRHFILCTADPDEAGVFNALSNMNPSRLDFNPHYVSYGGGYIYPLAAWLKTLDLLGALRLVPDTRYYYADTGEMGKIYVAARAFGAAAGTLALLALTLLAWRLSGSVPWSLLPAAMTFSSPIVISIARLTKPHFAAAAVTVLVLWLTRRYVKQGGEKRFLLAMAACGLSMGTVVNTFVIALLPLLARLNSGGGPKALARAAALGLAAMAGAALLVNPYWVLSLRETMFEFGFTATHNSTRYSLSSVYNMFRYGFSFLPGLAVVAALAFGAFRYRALEPFHRVLLQFLLLIFPLIVSVAVDPAKARWAIFVIPVYFLFAAEMGRLSPRPRAALAALLLCALAAAADGLRYRSYYLYDSDPATSTRLQAADWIEANAPRASLAHFHDLIPHTFPPVRLTGHRIAVYGGTAEFLADAERPDYVIASGPIFYGITPEQKAAFLKDYRLEKKFANPVEASPESWLLHEANLTVYLYKRV